MQSQFLFAVVVVSLVLVFYLRLVAALAEEQRAFVVLDA